MNRMLCNKYVVETVKAGSVSKAAKFLGVSQPAVSQAIASLEKELGYDIFIRNSSPIKLTREGSIYYEFLNKFHNLEEEYSAKIREISNAVASSISVGGPVVYIDSLISNAVLEYTKKNPNAHFSLKCASLSQLILLLDNGDLDCIVCTSDKIPGDFEKTLIFHEHIFLVVPKDNPINEALMNSSSAPDYSLLSGQDYIFLENDQPLQRQMNDFFKHYNIIPKSNITVNQASSAFNMTSRGAGICFSSEACVMLNGDFSKVCVYNLPDTVMGRNIYLAYKKSREVSEVFRDFVDYVCNKNTIRLMPHGIDPTSLHNLAERA